MAIEKINFSYPKNSLQSVFEGETKTALELSAMTAKKVDECVELVNGVQLIATEATAVVDEMRNAQDQFLTDNTDVRNGLIADNQAYIADLTADKATFEADYTATKNSFITNTNQTYEAFVVDTNVSKTAYKNNLDAELATFQGATNTAYNDFVADVNADKTAFETSYTATKDSFIANSNATYESFVSNINATKATFVASSNEAITDFEADKVALFNTLTTVTIPADVSNKLALMVADGTIADAIDQQVFAGINAQIATNNDRVTRTNSLSKTLTKLFTKQTVKIVFNGDSFTIGHLGGGINTTNPFPLVVQTMLRQRYEYANITCYNNGVSGRRADQAITTFDADTLALSPDLVVIMYGINEARETTSLVDYKTNMNTLINKCLTAGVEVLILTPCPTVEANQTTELQIYNNGCIEIAKQNNVAYIDMHKEFNMLFDTRVEDKATFYGTDTIHLKDGKYSYIADIIMKNYLFPKVQPLFVTGDKTVPIVFSHYVATNCSRTFSDAGQETFTSYYMSNIESELTYLTVDFYVGESGLDFYLVDILNGNVGTITYTLDGVTGTINGIGSLTLNHKDLIKANISKGRHSITFLSASITPEVRDPYPEILFHFSAFKFIKQATLLNTIPNTVVATPEMRNGKQVYQAYFTGTALTGQQSLTGPFSGTGIEDCWIDNAMSYWKDGTVRYTPTVTTSAGALSMFTLNNVPSYNNASTNTVVYHIYVKFTYVA